MISVIIPFINEAESLVILIPSLDKELSKLNEPFEVMLVDNGSRDGWEKKVKLPSDAFKVVKLRRPDKGRALRKGIARSTGEVIVFMDADLQDDPADLPRFWAKIQEGYEFVNGYRKSRHDTLDKRIPSYLGNKLVLKHFLGSNYHDINCGYKMFRRECLKDIALYGDNFRFLPVLVEKLGFKTTEVEVTHHSRKHGKSKYGFFNRLSAFADILTSYFIFRFAQRPLHFFGAIGGVFFALGAVITLVLVIERLFTDTLLKDRPLFLGGLFMVIVGVQIIMTGIIGELIVYTSKKSKMA